MLENAPIPVTVVAGFLGAGKTTLMNDLLNHAGDRRLAVLVNDFGEINVDESLIAEVTDNVQALTNGYICCSMQGELIDQIGALATRDPAPEHILIECSGVSEPARLVRTLGYPELRQVVRLDSVTTIVDPTTLPDLEQEYAELARAQIGAADMIVLNKTDLVSRTQLDGVLDAWVGGTRPVIETVEGCVSPEVIFDSRRDLSAPAQATAAPPDHHGFDTWHITLPGIFRLKALRRALDHVPGEVFRMKGCITLAERPGEWFWMHWVGGRTDIREAAARDDDIHENQIVVISRASPDLHKTLHGAFQDCLVESHG